jgi:selenocysteine lyase/cysteine desulfurase
MAHQHGALAVVDARPIRPTYAGLDVQDLGCDFLAFSGA